MMDNLRLKQVSTKLQRLKVALSDFPRFKTGYIRLLRQTLGMTLDQLGKRVGVTKARINAIEKQEINGNIKIATLEMLAESLNCQFFYAFVPNEPLEDFVNTEKKKIAAKRAELIAASMSLENQSLDKEMIENIKKEVLSELDKKPSKIWGHE